MIIVFSNDQTVSVLPDIDSVHRECETVDVEDGAYRFFDESFKCDRVLSMPRGSVELP